MIAVHWLVIRNSAFIVGKTEIRFGWADSLHAKNHRLNLIMYGLIQVDFMIDEVLVK